MTKALRMTEAEFAARVQRRVGERPTVAAALTEAADARHAAIKALEGVNIDSGFAKYAKSGINIDFSLPWPPSANAYWRHPTTGKLAGRHLISEEGREYRRIVHDIVMLKSLSAGLSDLVAVEVLCYPPDRRRRDLGNLEKALFDSLTHAGVWEDDSQVDDMRFRRARDADGKLILGGRVNLSIRPII
jgi:crossover junction endodeoxyribonuclease RusA